MRISRRYPTRVLVTGGLGFIGRSFAKYSGCDVFPVDIRVGGDAADEETLYEAANVHRPEWILHLAAATGRELVKDYDRALHDNVKTSLVVSSFAQRHGIPLAYTSSSEVYGDVGSDLVDETVLRGRDHNLYGVSKRWGEEAVLLNCPDALICRLTMPYGRGEPGSSMYPGFGKCALINFIWAAINGQEIRVHEGAARSWCYISDLIIALGLLMQGGHSGIFNVGRDDDLRTMKEVAELALFLAHQHPCDRIREVPAPGNVSLVKNFSTAKLRSTVPFLPAVSLEEGMKLVTHYLKGETHV